MKIIIVENELYLAQSIASKLSEYHFETEIFSSVKEAMSSSGDVYLVSTNLPGQNFMPLIERFADRDIILMVNYINNDTVGEPLKRGAKDYIVKPFIIEELVRKIEHYHQFRLLQERNEFYEDYTDILFAELDCEVDPFKLPIPVVIRTNYMRIADKIALKLNSRYSLSYISLAHENWQQKVEKISGKRLAYIVHLEKLKKGERERLFEILEGKKFILTDSSCSVETPFETITIESENKLYDQNEILTIDEYVKYIVKNFQYRFPDTELSKRLGISRKSLWEKRKKYDLFKKK